MRGFTTLYWLELRRSGVWAVALLGSLALWAWGIYQAQAIPAEEGAEVRMILLVMAAVVGAGVLALMVGRLRGDSRGGQYQVLLLTPPSGLTHIAARFAFACSVACVYYLAWSGLLCWAAAMAGSPLGAGDVVRLVAAASGYSLACVAAPLLAWTLLLTTFTSAYRVSGPAWVPGTVMVIGSVLASRWLIEGTARITYRLPSWALYVGHAAPSSTLIEASPSGGRTIVVAAQGVVYLPQEPLWIGLAVAALLVVVAGRIWREVEA